jgi:hypothetical protein
MRPEMPDTKRIIDPPLLFYLRLSTDVSRKVPFKMIPQHLNIGMHHGLPSFVNIVDIRHVDLLAAETSNNLRAVVLLFRYFRFRSWADVMGIGALGGLDRL